MMQILEKIGHNFSLAKEKFNSEVKLTNNLWGRALSNLVTVADNTVLLLLLTTTEYAPSTPINLFGVMTEEGVIKKRSTLASIENM